MPTELRAAVALPVSPSTYTSSRRLELFFITNSVSHLICRFFRGAFRSKVHGVPSRYQTAFYATFTKRHSYKHKALKNITGHISASSAASCLPCPPGTIAPGVNSTRCTPCPNATFNPQMAGTVRPISHQLSITCVRSLSCDSAILQTCLSCPPGMVSAAAAATCTACPWNTTAVANSCVQCSEGSFTTTRPAESCMSCKDSDPPLEFCPVSKTVSPPQSTTSTLASTPAPPAPLEHTVRSFCFNVSNACYLNEKCHGVQVPVMFLPLFMIGAILCTCCKCNRRSRTRVPEEDKKDKKEKNGKRRIPTTAGEYSKSRNDFMFSQAFHFAATWAALLKSMQALKLKLRGQAAAAHEYATQNTTSLPCSHIAVAVMGYLNVTFMNRRIDDGSRIVQV